MEDMQKYLGKYEYDVSVILVNYNGKRYIQNLFESLKHINHEGFCFEVVFVDNNSSDDSVQYLESIRGELNFDLNIVKSKINRGFAGGNNLGVMASKGEYIVFLNNDTIVDRNWLSTLFYSILEEKDRVCMVNSKLYYYYNFIELKILGKHKAAIKREYEVNGEKCNIENKYCKNIEDKGDYIIFSETTIVNIPITWTGSAKIQFYTKSESVCVCLGEQKEVSADGEICFDLTDKEVCEESYPLIQNAGSGVNQAYDGYDIGNGERDSEKYLHSYEITNACGASVIMRKDDFVNCGMFDSRFFMYYEDTDLSYRMRRGGKKILYCPESVVRHIHTGSSKEWSPFFTYHVYRNKLLFVFKNISRKLYFKQLIVLYRQGKKENNFYKMCGCKDSLKIILKMKKNTQFRW